MIKAIVIFFTLLTAASASGCADRSSFNSPDQQRAHADKGQGEMSSDLKK
jgi:hypothetical protein